MEGIKLAYQGSQSRLTPEQKQEVITWLKQKNYWSIEELANFIAEQYEVEFSSRQSYSALLHKAGIVWKKAQAVNPKKDEAQVALKKKRLPIGFKSGNPK